MPPRPIPGKPVFAERYHDASALARQQEVDAAAQANNERRFNERLDEPMGSSDELEHRKWAPKRPGESMHDADRVMSYLLRDMPRTNSRIWEQKDKIMHTSGFATGTGTFCEPDDWALVAEAPGIHMQRTHQDFYATVEGEGFLALPNIRIQAPPIISFHLHDLAAEPNWRMRVQQRVNNHYETSLKISILNRRHKNSFLKIKTERRSVITSMEEVVQTLRKYDGKFGCVNVPMYSPGLQVENMSTEARRDLLKALSCETFSTEARADILKALSCETFSTEARAEAGRRLQERAAALAEVAPLERVRRDLAAGELTENDILQMLNEERYERIKDLVEDAAPEMSNENVISLVDELIARGRPSVRTPAETLAEVMEILRAEAA